MSEQRFMHQAQLLTETGKHREAVEVLKAGAEQSSALEDRMFCAGTLVSIIVHSIHGGELPSPGTPDYEACRNYAKLSLACFEQADVVTRSGFHDLAEELRTTLQELETDALHAGVYQQEVGAGREGRTATNTDIRVGMSLLDEVEERINHQLGKLIAMPFGAEYNAEYDVFAKEMIKQCELAEKKLARDQPGVARSNFLKGRLYGVYYQHGPMAYRAGHKKGVLAYEKAVELGFDESTARYHLAILYAAGLSKDNAIQNFQRVIQIQGPTSQLGIECAKEIEKLKAKKGACFVATAVYDSPIAPQVLVLRRFRDEALLTSRLGKALVELYYFASPPLASLISRTQILKVATRHFFLEPALWLIKRTSRFR